MKRLLVFAVLLIASPHLFAQSFDEGIRYWKDGPLTWDDLTLRQTKDTAICDLSFRWLYEPDTLRPAWNTVHYTSHPEVVLFKPSSWHNASRRSDLALQYDQILFDLNEVYFRKLLTEYNRKDNQRSFNILGSFYSDEINYKIREMADDTHNGQDSTAVQEYRTRTDALLASTSYPAPAELRLHLGLSFYGGVSAFMLCGEAASTFMPAIGGNFGMSYMYKRHVIDLMMSMGDGRLNADFATDNYLWPRGDSYSHGFIGLFYEYMLYHGTTFSVRPMVGIGGRMIDWSTGTGDGKISDDASNTVAVGGLETHFIFARTIRGDGAVEHSLALKAFAARDIERSGLHAWSLNFGLSYCFGMHD